MLLKTIVSLGLLLVLTYELTPGKIVIALNCGAAPYEVKSGRDNFKFQPDQPYAKTKKHTVEVDYHGTTNANESDLK